MRFLRLVGALAIASALGVAPLAAQTSERGWLGLNVETLTPQLMHQHGLVVPFGDRGPRRGRAC